MNASPRRCQGSGKIVDMLEEEVITVEYLHEEIHR